MGVYLHLSQLFDSIRMQRAPRNCTGGDDAREGQDLENGRMTLICCWRSTRAGSQCGRPVVKRCSSDEQKQSLYHINEA
jgi:hypothetical protein